jgi:hypothetical protein
MFDRLAKLLGVKYSVEELRELVSSLNGPKRKRRSKGNEEPIKELFIPHAILTNPQSLEILKNAAKGMKLKTSDRFDMSSWDPATYKAVMNNAIQSAANALLQQEADASSQVEAKETET